MSLNFLIKDPAESELYNVEFASRLSTGETVVSATFTPSPTGITIGTVSTSGSIAQARISGGTSGIVYVIDVIATTSNSNTLNDSVRLLVQECYWMDEMVRILRYMIDDLADTPKYSDARLGETLLVAAREVASSVSFDTSYYVNVNTLTLSPDPTVISTRDDAFINLVEMKAACIIGRAEFKKAAGKSFSVKDGPSSIDNRGVAGNTKLYADDVCKAYDDAVYQFVLGHRNPGEAIIGPYKIYGQNGWNPTIRDRTYFS